MSLDLEAGHAVHFREQRKTADLLRLRTACEKFLKRERVVVVNVFQFRNYCYAWNPLYRLILNFERTDGECCIYIYLIDIKITYVLL